jgi:hypothetical protein
MPNGFIAIDMPMLPGELFEVLNPVIDFQRENSLVEGERLTSQQIALKARGGNHEREK